MGELEGQIRAAGGALMVIYTSYGWDVSIEDAAEHIGESFSGGYWTGHNPPISLNVLPANAVIDMQTGILLATTLDIGTPEDILPYVEAAAGD